MQPTFTYVELLIIADAVTQYSENREGAEADGREEETFALREKLDAYVAGLSDSTGEGYSCNG